MVRRNGKGRGEVEYFPTINLNLPGHRKALMGVLGAVAVTIPFLTVMTYEGYHYADSNSFCGGVCHDVMHPQYLAHRRSPHARVDCATCHIGRGASWYVTAKLSGIFRTPWNAADDVFMADPTLAELPYAKRNRQGRRRAS